MRLRTLFVCAGVLCSLLASSASASTVKDCALFTRNLKAGMNGEDVRILQQLLNNDSRTTIAQSGIGAKGSESTYFGTKTKLAVIKFQELYKDEVLIPAGLTHGSGYIGLSTRKKLLALCASGIPVKSATTPIAPTPLTQTPIPTPPLANSNTSSGAATLSQLATPIKASNVKPILMYPENYAVRQGETLVIYGGGFTPTNNTISVGATKYTGLTPTSDGTLEVNIPSTAIKGKFDLKFSNAKGESNTTFLVITDPNAIAPKVSKFTPTAGVVGTTVTVSGENFSKDWNDIVVGAKIITGVVSPDGKTLTFTATIPVPGVSAGEDVPNSNTESPLWFYVVNPNGISESSVFTVKF